MDAIEINSFSTDFLEVFKNFALSLITLAIRSPLIVPGQIALTLILNLPSSIAKVFVTPTRKIGSFFWKKGDIGIIDKFGPDGISKLIKIISNKTGRLQTGFIYDYAFVMLLGLSILLTYLILK